MRHPADLDAYALGGLEEGREREVEVHLAVCRRCRAEVRRLREGAALAVHALPAVPLDVGLRERVRTAAAPHLVAARVAAERDGPRPRRAWTPAGDRRRAAPVLRAARVRRAAVPVLAAVTLLAAVVAGGLALDARNTTRAVEGERALVAAWLTRDDVVRVTLPAREGERSPGSVMLANDGIALVVLRTPPPSGASYGVWGHGDDGSFEIARTTGSVVRVDVRGYRELGVSVDPGRYLGRVPLVGDAAF